MSCKCKDIYESLCSIIEAEKNITMAIERFIVCDMMKSLAKIEDPCLKANLFNSTMTSLNTRLCNMNKLINTIKCFPKTICFEELFEEETVEIKIKKDIILIYNPVKIGKGLILVGKLRAKDNIFFLIYNKNVKKYILIDKFNNIVR